MNHVIGLMLIVLAVVDASASARTYQLNDMRVIDGKLSGDDAQLMVVSKEMRAESDLGDNRNQYAALRFQYMGHSEEVSYLGNGELRHQLGIKFKAQNTCNVVYVMWNFDAQRIQVSAKLNPQKSTMQECRDKGYVSGVAHKKRPAPAVRLGEHHVLEAHLIGRNMTVLADGVLVWQGLLPFETLLLKGPVGLRSDNVKARFSFEAK